MPSTQSTCKIETAIGRNKSALCAIFMVSSLLGFCSIEIFQMGEAFSILFAILFFVQVPIFGLYLLYLRQWRPSSILIIPVLLFPIASSTFDLHLQLSRARVFAFEPKFQACSRTAQSSSVPLAICEQREIGDGEGMAIIFDETDQAALPRAMRSADWIKESENLKGPFGILPFSSKKLFGHYYLLFFSEHSAATT